MTNDALFILCQIEGKLGETFFICWITLQVLDFLRLAIGKKNQQNLEVQIEWKFITKHIFGKKVLIYLSKGNLIF